MRMHAIGCLEKKLLQSEALLAGHWRLCTNHSPVQQVTGSEWEELANNDEDYVSISFQIECNMMVLAIFFLISNQTEFCVSPKLRENCQYVPITSTLKGN